MSNYETSDADDTEDSLSNPFKDGFSPNSPTTSNTVTPLGIPKTAFINSSGQLYLQSLFFETALKHPHLAVYTLSDKDKLFKGKLYPSLYRLYLYEQDLTEFRFAETHLYSFYHWEKLLDTSFFPPYLEKWRRDLNLSITSRALQAVIEEAQTDSKNRFAANKILIERLGQEELQKASKRKPKQDTSDIHESILDDLSRLTQT